jgi:Tol biopolymer transport system component
VLFQKENGDTACNPETTIPGSGFCNDLWIVDRFGRRAQELYKVARDGVGALLHVAVSDDNTRILFSERLTDRPDTWALVVCTLRLGDRPSVADCTRHTPGRADFWYESHQFLDGGTDKLLFTCLCDPTDRSFKDVDIAVYTISTRTMVTLTAPHVWDEHAHQGPDGRILWASSQDNAHPLLLDWWVMNADGTRKQRLTFYNAPGHPDYKPDGVIAADNVWVGPNRFLGLLMTRTNQTGIIATWQLPEVPIPHR